MRAWPTLVLLIPLNLPLVFVTQPAFAQTPPPSPAPAGAVDPAASPKDQARQHYARGITAYEEGDFALALVEFQRAQAIAPDYRVLFNIGQVNLQLRRYAQGRAALRSYLAEGGKRVPADRQEAVKRDIDATEGKVARVSIRVEVQDPAQVTVDDVVVGNSPLFELEIDAGEHRIGARAPKHQAFTTVVTLVGGELKDVSLKLEPLLLDAPPPPPPRAPRPWLTGTWIGAGVLASGAVVTGILALSQQRKLENLKKDESSTVQEREDAASGTKTFAATADVLGLTAAVAAGVALYFTLRPGTTSAPVVALSPTQVSLRASF